MSTIDPATIAVRRAATVMLVRDGDVGLEVFMLRRNPASEFVGGAFVFPGGAVDDHDHVGELELYCVGLTDQSASASLGIESGGLAFWVAAIRECFEESGLLLAYDPAGSMVRFDQPDIEARFTELRRRVDNAELTMIDLCMSEGLTLACDTIHYFSHWITPVGPPRRYDTRFFVARAPDAQVGAHDDRETVANLWVRPSDALERSRAGERDIIFPTMRNLDAISRFDSADEVLEAARLQPEVPPALPRLLQENGGTRILLPGDPDYDDIPPDGANL
jgi:8-oxo-dGTP pyrophosphatase MutT (NUDIX family)